MSFEENVKAFIEKLKDFDYNKDGIDTIWKIIFPDTKGKFHYISVTRYQDVYYIYNVNGNLCTLEVEIEKGVKAAQSFSSSFHNDSSYCPEKGWDPLISFARIWLKITEKDWIKANKQILESYPLNCRYGIVRNSLIKELPLDFYQIDKELGKTKTKKFIDIVEKDYFHKDKNTIQESMTADDFFDYCKIAYLAGKRKEDYVDDNLSGRQMYERYADGRHEGLLEIAGDSKEEFADWIDHKHLKRTTGGHPWEIKRGGNTTHIDLYVTRPQYRKEGFEVGLRGRSIGRLKETICMFLAIQKAGLPITIDDPSGIRKRLLGQDNVGIVPCFDSLHRANQRFKEDVYDVIHYDDLGKYKRKILPFITWEPLPILKPKT